MCNLIVGDHESISIFGADIQNEMNEYSKALSEILLRKNSDSDIVINEILSKIEQYIEIKNQKSLSLFKTKKSLYKQQVDKYIKFIEFMDNATLSLQLRQAQLLKELKMLEKISEKIDRCIIEYTNHINYAEKMVSEYEELSPETEKKELRDWISRLKRKTNDLRISKTISLQNKAQLEMLQKNNELMIDKASTTITQIIPLWRNQICLILGIEKLTENAQQQNKIIDSIGRGVTDNILNFSKNHQDINISDLQAADKKLEQAIKNLAQLENKNRSIKSKINS